MKYWLMKVEPAAYTIEKLERGLRILHIYERFPQHNFDSKEAVLRQVADAVQEYQKGQDDEELPF